jgi:hypothetical protein
MSTNLAERRRAEREWWTSASLEAERLGACLRCFGRLSRYKEPYFVRHRKPCPFAKFQSVSSRGT